MSPNARFFARLEERVESVESLLCVGLDPRNRDLTEAVAEVRAVVAATASQAAAFKPNSAFFEAHGAAGLDALAELIRSIPDEVPVILDAKRGDIASTASAYAVAAFERLGADAVTVSPYLGVESIEPFLEYEDRGVFVLCRTSNPGGSDFQDATLWTGEQLFEAVAALVADRLPADRAGLVVGATQPAALAAVRQAASGHWILAPGVGAQGGDLASALAAGLRDDGMGMLITVSRSIAQAEDQAWAASDLRDKIWTARSGLERPAPSADLAADLFESGCIRFGDFELRSGLRSPIYLDLRSLAGHTAAMRRVARRYVPLVASPPSGGSPDRAFEGGEGGGAITHFPTTRIAGVPLGGLPIATAVALAADLPMVYPRPAKDHGTKVPVEGPFETGDRAVIVDDVVTSGSSILEAAEVLRSAGLLVDTAIVLVDRQGGAVDALAAAGIDLVSVTTLGSLVDVLESGGLITAAEAGRVRTFLASG